MGKTKFFGDERQRAYNLRIFVLVHVCIHVPDDLMREELRGLGRIENVVFHVSKLIVA